jgi:hypothetical protein
MDWLIGKVCAAFEAFDRIGSLATYGEQHSEPLVYLGGSATQRGLAVGCTTCLPGRRGVQATTPRSKVVE